MQKPLFKRNTDGSIQKWQIFLVGDSYYTVSGKLDMKEVTSAPTKAIGKNTGKANQTSPEQQAALEVAAHYKKKLESGYVENLEDLDNTGLLKPQLAKEYSEHSHKLTFPVISSCKLDGVRLNALDSGLYSRNGKPFVSVPHIHEAMKPLYEKYPDFVFDGELFNTELKHDFNKIISLVKKTKPTLVDLAESEDLIKFYIFDVFRKDGKETWTSAVRKEFIKSVVAELNHPSIVALDYTVCHNQNELDTVYAEYLTAGDEGQMINVYNATYSHSRTSSLLKRKEFQDAEFQIIDIVEGKGNREGCAVLVLQCGEKTFDCALKGTIDYAKDVYKNRLSLVGKMATVKFQNYTPENIPRFPVCVALRDYE